MKKNIKNLKPQLNGIYNQGYIDVNKCNKIYESQKNKPIIYRSSYEKIFIEYCERNNNIIKWASEPFYITYFNEWDKKTHKYYPDFIIEIFNNDNINNNTINIKKILIEIKPEYQVKQPKGNVSINMKKNYITNICKWRAAKIFCQNNGFEFKVITEKTINILKKF